MNPYSFYVPTKVIQEAGGIARLHEHCQGLFERPLIVTGKHAARKSGLLDKVRAQFPAAAVFDQVEENPTTKGCEAGGRFCREAGSDGIIALGGGSPMDAAKAIAVLATNPLPCAQYFGAAAYTAPPLPIVAVPTTAGTGSEVTPYAVLVDTEQQAKKTVKGSALFPKIALLDPALSLTLPPAITAATGLDALSQAMEGYLSKAENPIGDILAIEICRLVKRWLPVAVKEPDCLEARAAMLHAAMLSGIIIAHSGTTLVHGMGYYFTLRFGLAHGLANGLLLGPVFAWNAHQKPQKVAALCQALGYTAPEAPDALAEVVHSAVVELLHACKLSPAARDFGVEKAALAAFAEDIITDPYRFKNQVGEFTTAQVRVLFEAAWSGEAPGSKLLGVQSF